MSENTGKPNWFDNFIGFFSPRARLNRIRYKAASSLIERKYEGASVGRRTSGWKTASSSANTEIAGALQSLRNRSRDLVRNNPYAARGIQVIQNNVIGKGIRAEVKADTGRRARTNRREETMRSIWRAWAETPACDWEGQHDLFGLQSMAMRSVVESGECLIRLRRTGRQTVRTASGEIEVPPIQLQILEGEFLENTRIKREVAGKNTVLSGVEFSKDGKRVAYHLFKDHPGGLDSIASTFSTQRIDASEISHIYRQDRPGQVRGVPWLAPIMIRLRDFDEFEDAQLVRQKIASMFTAFVHDLEGLDETVDKCVIGEKVEPGQIEILPPGKSVTFGNPPSVSNYKEYTTVMLHSIASGLGITYEALTGDLSEVNFSSARMGFLEMNRNIDAWRCQIMIPKFNWPVFNWFLGALPLIGQNPDGVSAVWTPPRREMVDPTKEVPAMKDAVRSGFVTLSEVLRQGGFDPEKLLEEYARDNQRIDDLQLTLDSDPRKTSENER